MSDAKHLPGIPQCTQFAPHDLCDGTADARIHLVEHHAARFARSARHLHTQRQSRKLTARGHLREGAKRLARVRRHPEFDLIDAVRRTLKKGDSVSLIGFGTFAVTKRAARTGRNPRTGAAIKIKAAKIPKFRPGKGLKDAIK